MYRYKKLLVGMKLDERDTATIEYASLVSQMARSESVTFVHVTSVPDFSEDYQTRYPDMLVPAAAQLRKEMANRIEAHFSAPDGCRIDFFVTDGVPVHELLRLAKDEEMDLLVVGRDEYGGSLAEKLARKAPCSVLIIPADAQPEITRVLVPIDFSEHAKDAVDVAVAFSDAAALEGFNTLHIRAVPDTYYKIGKSYEEFANTTRRYMAARQEVFLRQLDLRGLKVTPKFLLDDNVPRAIRGVSITNDVDLIVLGARGRTDSAAVLLGSVTEHVIRTTHRPIVAVKKKGSNLSFLEAVLHL